jgi:hypothetical protein
MSPVHQWHPDVVVPAWEGDEWLCERCGKEAAWLYLSEPCPEGKGGCGSNGEIEAVCDEHYKADNKE